MPGSTSDMMVIPGMAMNASTKRCTAMSSRPPRKPGRHADQDPEPRAQGGGGQPYGHRNARPVHQAAEQIPPELVGPQPVGGGRRLQTVGHAHLVHVMGRQLVREDAREQHQHDHAAEHRPGRLPAHQLAQKRNETGAAPVVVRYSWRTRGSSHEQVTSVSRLTSTTTAANTTLMPDTSG